MPLHLHPSRARRRPAPVIADGVSSTADLSLIVRLARSSTFQMVSIDSTRNRRVFSACNLQSSVSVSKCQFSRRSFKDAIKKFLTTFSQILRKVSILKLLAKSRKRRQCGGCETREKGGSAVKWPCSD